MNTTLIEILVNRTDTKRLALFSLRKRANGMAVNASNTTINVNSITYSTCPGYFKNPAIGDAKTRKIVRNMADDIRCDMYAVL